MMPLGGARIGRALAGVLLVALAVRVAFILTIGNVPDLHGDESYYVAKASDLLAFGQYPGAFRPPGQSAFLAVVFLLCGRESLVAARLAQVAISLLTVGLVFDLARRRYSARAGVIAGLVCALHPTLVSYTSFLWSETLYAAFLVLIVWILDRYCNNRRIAWVLAAGVALGGCALTRETGLYLVPVVMAWVATKSPGHQARAALVGILGALVVVTPWMIRNYRQFDMATISTNRWRVIAYGNAREAIDDMRSRERPSRAVAVVERERVAREIAIRAIKSQQPLWIFRKIAISTTRLLAGKSQLARFSKKRWFAPNVREAARVFVRVETVVTLTVMALGILGLWLTTGDDLKMLVMLLIAYHWAIYVVTFANPRFVVPMVPFVTIYVGALLANRPWKTPRPTYAYVGGCATVALYGVIIAFGHS